MSRWTFLTNHAAVLLLLVRDPKITALEVARMVGITERSIRKIIDDLEREGYIQKTKVGKRNRYAVNHNLPLRQKSQQDKEVGKLLRALSGKG